MVGKNPSGSIQSVGKAMDILDILSYESSGLPLAEIARRLEFNEATAHHLLATMRQRGFVDQDPETRAYRLGQEVIALANRFLGGLDAFSAGRGPLQELRDRSGETAYLSALQGSRLVTLLELPGSNPIQARRVLHEGETIFHSTASGKCLLAYMPDRSVDALLETSTLTRFTRRTIVDHAELRAELARIRAVDYALDREENLDGIMCISAPVFGRHGVCLADASVAFPRSGPERIEELIPLVVEAGRRISASLGYTPAPPAPAGETGARASWRERVAGS